MDRKPVLNLTPHRKAGASIIPGRTTTLSVSWLNRQFKAVAVHRGVIVGRWEHSGELEGANPFESLLGQAIQQTSYHGQTVSLVLAHPRLVQQALDVPPVKAAALRKILHRQAQQQKLFTGEAAWTSQISNVGKDAQRVILHLLPRALLTQLIQACQNQRLQLTAVSPPAGVLPQQLRLLPLERGQVALLAAETGGSTNVVIGRADGQVLLARTLPGTWNENAEQLATDLNRTILFFNEQFGLVLNRGIWLFGPGAEAHVAEVQRHTSIPVALSPVEHDPFYWAVGSLTVRPAALPNFISLEMQQAPRRHILARVVAGVTLFVVLALLVLSGYALVQARQEKANIQLLSRKQQRLETERQSLQQRNVQLEKRQQVARVVLDSRPDPVPLWFLGYLGEAVPPELVLTNLQVVREAEAWKVHLAGTLQKSAAPQGASALAERVGVFASRLTNAPFHLVLVDEEEKPNPPVHAKSSGIAAWVANVASGVSAKPPVSKDQFVLEGMMR